MNPTLLTRLRHLRLSGMAEALPARLAQAEGGSLSFLGFLELLVQDELARRADRLFTRRLKQDEVHVIKELKNFDWTFNPKIPKARLVELGTARFVAEYADLLLIGPPGLGKSHLGTTIAIGAIRAATAPSSAVPSTSARTSPRPKPSASARHSSSASPR